LMISEPVAVLPMYTVVVPLQPDRLEGRTSPVAVIAAWADEREKASETTLTSTGKSEFDKHKEPETIMQRRNTAAPPLDDGPMWQWTAEEKMPEMNHGQ